MQNLTHIPERRRFQIDIDGREAGHIAYEERDGGWDVTHTEVSPDFQGRGLAKILVDELMAHAAEHNIPITASCPYAARFIG